MNLKQVNVITVLSIVFLVCFLVLSWTLPMFNEKAKVKIEAEKSVLELIFR